MSKPTINDIFRENGKLYRLLNPKIPLPELKVMRSIEICRTDEIGARIEKCDNCSHTIIQNNSCRNRHCPQCQNIKKEEWIAARKSEVLPVTYFHIVFTLPDILNRLIWKNKKIFFNLLFRISKETLISIAADNKYFGADIGFFGVLHTWGQKLNRHPHIHCVVPGGGFSKKDGRWRHVPNNYLAPIKVVKARYKDLFIKNLKLLYESGELYLEGLECQEPYAFKKLIQALYAKEWIVYLKESFNNSSSVIEYLSRYTHKIAMSNYRILSVNDEFIEFKYRDYKDNNKEKIVRMAIFEFMQKFLMHTVPYRFVRIRYFGIFAHRNKQQSLDKCRKMYGILTDINQPTDWRDILKKKTGIDYSICPVCGNGKLVVEKFIIKKCGMPP
ncbi:IS91 family transposase [bacterium]|nr:IS91 family transposase [bacterium]